MSRLTRDGTAEPISRDQILRHARGHRGIFIFPVELTTSRIGNLTRLIHTLLYLVCDMTIHTYIHRMGTGMDLRSVAKMGTGTKGTGTRIGSGMAKKRLRSARNR